MNVEDLTEENNVEKSDFNAFDNDSKGVVKANDSVPVDKLEDITHIPKKIIRGLATGMILLMIMMMIMTIIRECTEMGCCMKRKNLVIFS